MLARSLRRGRRPTARRALSAQPAEPTDVLGVAIFGSIVAATAGLGAWQTSRYFWKVGLIEEREAVLASAPVALPADYDADSDALAFRPLRVRGRFLPGERQYLLGPRSPPKEPEGGGPAGAGAPAGGAPAASGHYVIAPFELDGGRRVLVNRGWARGHRVESVPAEALAVSGERVELLAVLAAREKPQRYAPPDELDKGHLYSLAGLDAVAEAAGLADPAEEAPILLDMLSSVGVSVSGSAGEAGDSAGAGAEDAPLVRKERRHYVDFYVTPWKHAVYAGTWFTLAVCGVLLTRNRFRARRRR